MRLTINKQLTRSTAHHGGNGQQIWARFCLAAILLSGPATSAADTRTSPPPQDLRAVVEVQQQQIAEQQEKLEAQQVLLEQLTKRLNELSSNGLPPIASPSPNAPGNPDGPFGEPRPPDPDWAGSFGLFDTDTRLAIDGYVQLDIIHDSDAIGAPCQFITATIPTNGASMVDGAGGQTHFCVNTSRLSLESRTPLDSGRLKTFISMDFYGNALSASPEPRLRQAFAELSDTLWGGNLLIGQAWGTYVDLEAWPNILDFEGPGSAIAVRQPMVRWSKQISDRLKYQLAVEQPGEGIVVGADMLTRWPDFVATLKYDLAGGGHVRGAGILRDLRVSANDGPAESTLGWGIAGSGKVMLPARNNIVFEVSYGKGVGAYYSDGPINGVYEPDHEKLNPLPLLAYYIGFEHQWSDSLTSSALYSAIETDHLGGLPDTAGDRSEYFSLNLVWRPDKRQMYGIEFLSGSRRDKSGAKGTDNRVQLSAHYSIR